ncbi:hypothetical protein M0Q97_05535 [Candidatus Dojkabacteria bacterium]|jgi:hypothetical protein|nr:hypothetical protein [Candidatus Dojkabacteria bacterium]
MKKISLNDLVTIKKIDDNYSMFEYYQFDYKSLSSHFDQYDSIYPAIQKISHLNHVFINNDITCDNIIEEMLKNKKYKLSFETRKNIDYTEIINLISECVYELKNIPYQHNIKLLMEPKYIYDLNNINNTWFLNDTFYQDKYKDKIIIFDSNQNKLFHNNKYYGFNLSCSHVIEIAFKDELRLRKLKRVLYE